MFRIGRFKKPRGDESTTSRPRPILLKLASPWDRRLVLANRSNLKHYSVKGIFVREDLSLSRQVDLGLVTTSAEPCQK